MRKDTIQDFDSQVKSILQNAEEPVPSGLWESVSARVAGSATADASASGSVWAAPVFWRWAGVAFACACALTALLVIPFGGKSDPASTILTNHYYISEAAPVEVQIAELPAASPLTAAVSRRLSSAEAPAAEDRSDVFVPSEVSAPAAFEPEYIGTEPAAPAEPSEQPLSTTKTISETSAETWTDPFAEVKAEEAAESRKISRTPSLTVDGIFGGNDSEFGGNGARPLHSSGETGTGIKENSVSTYGIPLSVGVGIRFPLGDRFSVGTGLEWSMLTRTFTGTYNTLDNGDITHIMHYVGVPVDFFYNVFDSKSVMLYAFAGGEAEYCLSNKYFMYSKSALPILVDPVKSVQFSVNFGMGAEFKLTEHLGLYMNPGASYYFPCNQPKSVRTDRPFMFNFDLGLRFIL